ncbi:MAG: hypothetical protein J5640_04315 [Bacteroidales bacterium]|nr:hypothetical protein [Bacteroidales bacterium]
MSLFGCGKEDANRKPEGAFKEYEYKESNMREYPAEYYLLEVSKDNGLTLTWAKHNSDFTVLRVPEDAAEKLTALINEHKLHKLKNSYRPPFDVRDGTMWHVYIRYEKSRISCSADNAWPPKDLWNGILAINAYLDSLIEASRESDIIEVRKNR